jgi:hypothetical protein
MWSSGTRLTDSTKVVGSGPIEDDLPEYMVMRSSRPHPWVHSLFRHSVEERRVALALQHVGDTDNQFLDPRW